MDSDEVLLDVEERMEKAVEFFSKELGVIRTGRASSALVENIKVDYYGTKTSMRELCAISVPEPRLIVIRPFDPGVLEDVEKGILKADLGMAPMNDGKLLRLAIPPMTEETRKQMSSRIKEMAEEARTSVRNIRRDANKMVDKAQKSGDLPEDDAYRTRDDIQSLTGKYEEDIDEKLTSKVEEIMEI